MSEASLEQARELARAGDAAGAAGVLERYLEAHPGDTVAHFQLAHLALGTGDPAGAAERFRRVLDLDPDHGPARNDLGTALEALGRMDEAEDAYAVAAAARPAYPPACYNLALVRCRARAWTEAAELLETALRDAPDFRATRLQLGFVLRRLGRDEDARACYGVLLAERPADPETLRVAAEADMEMCRFAEAAAYLERSLDLAPGDEDATLALGTCLQELGRVDDAVRHYRRLLVRNPARYYDVVKKLTGASRGRFLVSAADLRQMLLG